MTRFQFDQTSLQQADLQGRFAYEMRQAHERQQKRIQMGPGDVIEVVFELDTLKRPPIGGHQTQRVSVAYTQAPSYLPIARTRPDEQDWGEFYVLAYHFETEAFDQWLGGVPSERDPGSIIPHQRGLSNHFARLLVGVIVEKFPAFQAVNAAMGKQSRMAVAGVRHRLEVLEQQFPEFHAERNALVEEAKRRHIDRR